MGVLEELITMELSRNLIYVLALIIIVENPTPLINLVLFSICKSFNYISWKPIELNTWVDALAYVKRCSRVDKPF